MDRDRECVPVPPHGCEQSPKSDHCPGTQSTAQGCTLHICVSTVLGQLPPLFCGAVFCVRVRVCTPEGQPSHVQSLLQAPHAPQRFMAQSTGQGWLLHVCWSSKAGHTAAPYSVPLG